MQNRKHVEELDTRRSDDFLRDLNGYITYGVIRVGVLLLVKLPWPLTELFCLCSMPTGRGNILMKGARTTLG